MNEAKPPVEGMTVMPAYLNDDPLMGGMFTSFLFWGLSENEVLERFKDETGTDLVSFVRRSPIEAMVDEATGFKRASFVKFCDWLTINYWGVAGSEGTEPEDDL